MKRITLRLPDDLAEAIEKLAANQDRSLNAEIIQAIKYYVDMARRREKFDKDFEDMKKGDYVELS